MLAVSSWTWIVVAAFGLLTLGILIRATLGLISRLKELNRTLKAASGSLQSSLEEMRSDLEEASEGLAELSRRREQDAG